MDKELEQWKEKCHQLTLKLNSQEQIHRVEVEFHKEETASKEQELKSLGETLKAEFKCREKKFQEQVINFYFIFFYESFKLITAFFCR